MCGSIRVHEESLPEVRLQHLHIAGSKYWKYVALYEILSTVLVERRACLIPNGLISQPSYR